MKILKIRNVTVGEGMPKIIAPIVGCNRDAILAEAEAIARAGADICEWRIDLFAAGDDAKAVIALARELRIPLGDMPLLITFRTANEGGAKAISPDAYADLLSEICTARAADMVDVEMFIATAPRAIACARENGVICVASNHDFAATPSEDEILRRLTCMADAGADIAKIAVMPGNATDVTTLLRATARAAQTLPCPLITMSMGRLGAVSRLAGETFGSACTFGSVGQTSAPGQMPVSELRRALQLLHG